MREAPRSFGFFGLRRFPAVFVLLRKKQRKKAGE
jgi:hypothetical protein